MNKMCFQVVEKPSPPRHSSQKDTLRHPRRWRAGADVRSCLTGFLPGCLNGNLIDSGAASANHVKHTCALLSCSYAVRPYFALLVVLRPWSKGWSHSLRDLSPLEALPFCARYCKGVGLSLNTINRSKSPLRLSQLTQRAWTISSEFKKVGIARSR